MMGKHEIAVNCWCCPAVDGDVVKHDTSAEPMPFCVAAA
jgi:hypothetical protein